MVTIDSSNVRLWYTPWAVYCTSWGICLMLNTNYDYNASTYGVCLFKMQLERAFSITKRSRVCVYIVFTSSLSKFQVDLYCGKI